jgi:predicted dehydrogenase
LQSPFKQLLEKMTKTNWGIIGLGKIAHHFVRDLQTVENANLYAVASRSQAKADTFLKQYQADMAYGSYDDLLADQNVDIVYIATPHVYHKENSIAVLKSGKAVLCEKPFAMNTNEVEEMIEVAQAENQFLMEALWTNFMPTIKKLTELCDQKTYGDITNLQADFCFKPEYDPQSRLFNPKLGGGALLDIGIYPVYLALKLLGNPDKISAHAKMTQTGVDLQTKITFEYKNGIIAELYCSFDENTPSEATIRFQDAEIKLHSRFHETDKLSIIQNSNEKLIDFEYKAKGYHFEIMHAQECLQQGLKESPLMPFKFSKLLISTLDEIRQQIGLEY